MFIILQQCNISQVEVVKELLCGHGDEGSILFNDIPNLVLNECNMITCVLND
jgi:hypothetical protein